ncbi:hypothetical protein DFH08DRAFT_825319 [Mycena albidolilacea]|uniref:Uncharacterized protein n=1 Tax=Mycena albidolilacea TaxID=1033008 RepID=A0AAD7E9B9_9AGAR|nr:hypothetical protein DFH08DRAFT_825319 [Mycena albidolilacea]
MSGFGHLNRDEKLTPMHHLIQLNPGSLLGAVACSVHFNAQFFDEQSQLKIIGSARVYKYRSPVTTISPNLTSSTNSPNEQYREIFSLLLPAYWQTADGIQKDLPRSAMSQAERAVHGTTYPELTLGHRSPKDSILNHLSKGEPQITDSETVAVARPKRRCLVPNLSWVTFKLCRRFREVERDVRRHVDSTCRRGRATKIKEYKTCLRFAPAEVQTAASLKPQWGLPYHGLQYGRRQRSVSECRANGKEHQKLYGKTYQTASEGRKEYNTSNGFDPSQSKPVKEVADASSGTDAAVAEGWRVESDVQGNAHRRIRLRRTGSMEAQILNLRVRDYQLKVHPSDRSEGSE